MFMSSKRVCEIGCGHGLLGIGAGMLGAKEIVFQDYNANVIEQLTKPTVDVNYNMSNNNNNKNNNNNDNDNNNNNNDNNNNDHNNNNNAHNNNYKV